MKMPAELTFDANGIEDLVIAARCTNPLMDADEYSFMVIDPYFAFFGYCDPRLSSEFVTDDPTRRSMVPEYPAFLRWSSHPHGSFGSSLEHRL